MISLTLALSLQLKNPEKVGSIQYIQMSSPHAPDGVELILHGTTKGLTPRGGGGMGGGGWGGGSQHNCLLRQIPLIHPIMSGNRSNGLTLYSRIPVIDFI